MPALSKSTYLMGLQCPKLLWFRYNDREAIPEPDEAQQAIFDQGHEVGRWAKRLFPDGMEVGEDIVEVKEVARRTQELLPQRQPLFEAAFLTDTCYSRADILVPAGRDKWDLVEVKSSTSVKDINLHDLAFQKHVYTSAGLKIRHVSLLHINGDYVRQGDIDPEKLFTRVELSSEIAPLLPAIPEKVREMLRAIQRKDVPDIRIGKQCGDPYDCPLVEKCWSFLPEHNVCDLYMGGKKAFNLLNDGVKLIADIPDTVNLTGRQSIQRKVTLSGKPHVDRKAIRGFLARLEYPWSFLDFETFATAIPLFDQTSPYEQVPFQYSLHVVERAGAELRHCHFLAKDKVDPRPAFLRHLRENLPPSGSVITYNASFEIGRMEACCRAWPDYRPWWNAVRPRIVDLLEPFRSFDYYHPGQHGSASIKAVLPALTGEGYEHLSIQDGGAASRAYLAAVFGNVTGDVREQTFRDLEAYCGLDTEGMTRIIRELGAFE